MGELHLEILVDRLRREFKVNANVGRPQVAYRETITAPVEARGRFVRQSGGHGQYGDVLHPDRAGPGPGLRLGERDVGGVIPREYRGARSSAASKRRWKIGVLAGYPVVDVKVTLLDGSYHEVDS